MTFESEPLDVQQQSDTPLSPEKPREWTPPFKFLVTLVALIGLAATLFGISGRPIGNELPLSTLGYFTSNQQADLVLNVALLIICLTGVWLASGALLRVGLLLRAIASLGAIFLALPSILLALREIPPWLASLYLSIFFLYTPPYLELALGILGLLTQICFSYGLARWQRSDNVFIWVQIAVTLGLGTILLKTSPLYPGISWALVLEVAGGAFLSTATAACFLLRPACWKANPLIVLCFTAGTVVLLIFDELYEHFFHMPATQLLQITFAISLAGSTLFILGVLLLIQRARMQKKAQKSSIVVQ